ncbi:MAG: YccF domain-containing protein [Eubacterium sp.]|nr:YccF domain-containing protein [Eubacterium sp.]
MRLLGNILWIVFGGWISALGWVLAGCLWCITIIGIPVGVQCFKLASISLNPFGKEVYYEGKAGSFLLNVIWFLVSGMELAFTNFLLGCILCITIIGIPFGKQYFKIAKLSLAPFGAAVRREAVL